MQNENSITKYFSALKRGESEAAQLIWEKFFKRLIELARKKLKSSPKRWSDEDDIVQQAFAQFFSQVQQNRFPKLNNRGDLWQILAMLVDRRATDQIRRQVNKKSGGGKVRGDSAFIGPNDSRGAGINSFADNEPTADLAAEFVEELAVRLQGLKNDEYRQIALLKLQNYTNKEIADKIRSSVRTVERCLNNIRKNWQQGSSDESSEPE